MKPAAKISMTAVALLMASAGVLYPLHGSISEAGGTVASLSSEIERDANLHEMLTAARERLAAVQERLRNTSTRLCRNTPEAEHEFETSILELVDLTGLQSVRMDRRPEAQIGKHSGMLIDLVVDGDGLQLFDFLRQLEDKPLVTRVLMLSVEPGQDTRRVTIQVAVMKEQKS